MHNVPQELPDFSEAIDEALLQDERVGGIIRAALVKCTAAAAGSNG